jgi:copper chaperone CopZ
MKRLVLHIEGMSCGHCLNAVNQALASVPDTRIASVRIGRAEVDVSEESQGDALVTAVEDAGYSVALVDAAP